MSDAAWETLSNQAIAAAGIVYFLALLSHLVEWSALRTVPVSRGTAVPVAAGVGSGSSATRRRRPPPRRPRTPRTRRRATGSRCSAASGCC